MCWHTERRAARLTEAAFGHIISQLSGLTIDRSGGNLLMNRTARRCHRATEHVRPGIRSDEALPRVLRLERALRHSQPGGEILSQPTLS